MNLDEYLTLVIETNTDVFIREDLIINDNFDTDKLLVLCTKAIPRERLLEAWSIIISSVINKFKDCKEVKFFPDNVLDFLIENDIDLVGLGHLRLPDKYLNKIYEKDKNCWEAKENLISL